MKRPGTTASVRSAFKFEKLLEVADEFYTQMVCHRSEVQADCLATLGLFAYLGRMTRIFLSNKGIKDLDLLVKDLISRRLLIVCLEDYWAAYDISSSVLLKITETIALDHMPSLVTQGAARFPMVLEEKQDLAMQGHRENKFQHTSNLGKGSSSAGADTIISVKETSAVKSTSLQESFNRKWSNKLLRTSTLHGYNYKITTRERKKLKRTLNDIATLVPITVLMLLPLLSQTSKPSAVAGRMSLSRRFSSGYRLVQ
ncbi:hypothetical protein Dsin_013852 [Dipteronia sinensis]|uniref:Uncharacterized protein n=1 Tax=Dipteronia sinensis TaxID=43782 RepID=A0AAE0ALV2_9ROSI|nr:hypothetical protein Dsin_013852 [Dipteronia sinensis]